MSRSAFRSWGLDLSPDGFASALTALGVLQSRMPLFPDMSKIISPMLGVALSEGPTTTWTLAIEPGQLESLAAQLPAGLLASAWANANVKSRQLRLQVVQNPPFEPILPWIIEQLSRNAVSLGSVSVIEEVLRPFAKWNWPLQVGCLSDPASRRLYDHLKSSWGGSLLAKVRLLEADGDHCDLLLFPGSLREGVTQVLSLSYSVRSSCVAVLGGLRETWLQARPFKTILQQETGAAGICIINMPASDRGLWFDRLIEELSHNQPLDISLHRAAFFALREPNQFTSLFFTNPQLLLDSQLGNVARSMIDRIGGMAEPAEAPPASGEAESFDVLGIPSGQGNQPIDLSQEAANPLGVSPGTYSYGDLYKELRARLDSFGYSGESHEATGLAHLSNELDSPSRSAPQGVSEPRWIQAQVFDLGRPDQPLRLSRLMRAGASLALDVRIGPRDADWLAPPASAVFPDWLLPENTTGHILKVVFSEPHHVPEPQVQTILLPPRHGSSTTCRFYFKTLDEIPFEARIIVLHENRVLQTALLKAEVLPLDFATIEGMEQPGESLPPGVVALKPFPFPEQTREIKLEIETVVRPTLDGLESRRRFAAALVVNRSGDGQARGTLMQGDRARLISLEGIKQFTDQISDKLTEIAWSEKKFSRGLKAAETLKLLRFLAIQGSSLYGGIVEDQFGESAPFEEKPLQIISVLPESFLPMEFIYDKPAPAPDAKLCDQAEQALRTGSCSDCKLSDEVPNPTICPLGFWGLRRVIERHAGKAPDQGDLRALEFEVRAEPFENRDRLAPLVAAVYAASQRVDSVDAGQIQRVFAALDQATTHHAIQVDTWNQWKSEVLKHNPSLLMLLPHTFKDEDLLVDGLEISTAEHLLATYITPDHVHARGDFHPPIVLLLGCETQKRDIPFQGFVAQFRRKGAAIVVSTVSTVLGRHAAPVAEEIVSILQRLSQEKTASFGEVMLQLRRQALADGIPMVLSLFAYGDADWRIGGD